MSADPLAAIAAAVTAQRPPAADFSARPSQSADPPETGDDAKLDLRLAKLPLTDLGNAERFHARHRDQLLFTPALGWLWWDGRRWSAEDSDERVKRAEHRTVRAIQDEAKALADSADDVEIEAATKSKDALMWSDKVARWGVASENAARLAAIAKRASEMLPTAVKDLDADPMRINVQNGTLRVVRRPDGPYVTLHPHDPADLITKLAPVTYDPEAGCPLFARFMDEVHPPVLLGDGTHDRAMQVFLDQWAGYALTGDTGEHKMTFHYGKGRNGKSVWVNCVSHVAGDYADSIPIESFLDSGRARAGGQATPDIAGLPGVRCLTTSEPKKGAVLEESFVKLFTGGDRIKARHLNKGFFGFVPVAKLTMQGNYRPKISGTDEGIWGRMILVPWGVFIAAERRDPKLFEKLRGEASGMLNRFLDGLCLWLDTGLRVPENVVAATADYRADSDPLGRFLDVCTRQALGARVQSTDMHALFCAWARANGETEWTSKGLAAALKERGIAAKKSSQSFWLDLELVKRIDDFVDHNGKPWSATAPPDDADFDHDDGG